jgi:hypothetical protein
VKGNSLRYVCAASYYPNCRSCSSGYFSDLRFFPDLHAWLRAAETQTPDYEFHDLHLLSGRMVGEIGYEMSRHSVTGLTAKVRWLKLRTVDDGHGKWKWVRQ